MMQADKEETAAATAPAAGKPPSICDRLQRAFHARPAFRPLRRLTVRHQDGGAAKPADAGAGAGAAHGPAPKHKHSGPPVPAPPQPLTPSPAPVRLPAVAKKAAVASAPPGPPVPAPPPDVTDGMVTAADAKAGDKAQQTKAKTSWVGSTRVRKALSSK
ncbi:hypothetical protein SEVIR_9G400700v4 [Setaria viridis]|uniref:Uncharacterized protein n=2 Tax=Setaria TaxID=4554 RepID=K4AG43_SETIT|nr:skin secretory protein xP2 [Setaria italica]XP_034572133.1 skin secretory protein xP2-like [Setaria viridis]RCV44725.1 hypothetical protein SETIT_9G397700v2 [Setaria italica]TKV95998.1 hypothetical protein SEVIR_9G400700v2 [Setaria viridis]